MRSVKSGQRRDRDSSIRVVSGVDGAGALYDSDEDDFDDDGDLGGEDDGIGMELGLNEAGETREKHDLLFRDDSFILIPFQVRPRIDPTRSTTLRS